MAGGGKVDYFEEPDPVFLSLFFDVDFGLLSEADLSLLLVSFDFDVSSDLEVSFDSEDSFASEDSEPELLFEYPSAYQPDPLN